MIWLYLAIGSYFFGALTVILDKYLLSSEKIARPATYAFYVGILGMGVLVFWPLGLVSEKFQLHVPSSMQFLISMESGMIFLAAITVLYFAIKKSEASKVTPVVFSLVPVVTFLLAALQGIENFSSTKTFGIFLLIFGGLLISFDLPLKVHPHTFAKMKKYFGTALEDVMYTKDAGGKFFAGFSLSLLAGILMGFSTFTLKIVYLEQNFFNGYVWTRLGAFVGAFCLLLYPAWRKAIAQSFHSGKKNKKENLKTGGIFVLNKVLGGTSSALINLAIGMGSVTLVSALISLQYVFVLLIAVFAAKQLPKIFEERMFFWDWAQKILAIAIIAVGMYFIV